MFEGSKCVGMMVRGVGDFTHLFASEHQAGLAREKEETQVLGERAQAPGRAVRWAEGQCWYLGDEQM